MIRLLLSDRRPAVDARVFSGVLLIIDINAVGRRLYYTHIKC